MNETNYTQTLTIDCYIDCYITLLQYLYLEKVLMTEDKVKILETTQHISSEKDML